jgi:serine/threonine protein kinase
MYLPKLNRLLTEKVDSWGLGALAFSLLTGRQPFTDASGTVVSEEVLKSDPEFPADVDRLARDLIEQLLEKDPENRLAIGEVNSHPFVTRQHSRPLAGR